MENIIEKIRQSRWKNWPYWAIGTVIATIIQGIVESDLLTIPLVLYLVFFSFYTTKLITQSIPSEPTESLLVKLFHVKILRYSFIAVLFISVLFLITLFAISATGGIRIGH